MELTLRFKGELKASSSSNSRVPEKHAIREELHHQLAAFWAHHAVLSKMNASLKTLQITKRSRGHFEVARPIVGTEKFWWRYPLCGFDFIPLVTHVHELHCHIDIRLYRRVDAGGFLFEGGDLDNRLKTFFDALRVPHTPDQLPSRVTSAKYSKHGKDWPPLFCLLDDDSAITKLSIESFKMLTAVPSKPKNYVEMDMDVKIIPATPMWGSLDLLFP